jgi:HSP90 family molecular chaperone
LVTVTRGDLHKSTVIIDIDMKLVKRICSWIRSLRHKKNKDSDVHWCLIGNIIQERSYGEKEDEIRAGTKHFSPGTKVYCLPAQWGDGYDQILVIGRH